MSDLKKVTKVRKALLEYLSDRGSDPITLSVDWISLPHYIQAILFETVIAYIHEVARDTSYTDSGQILVNRQIAKDIIKSI